MDIKMEYGSIFNLCHGCLSCERNIEPVTGEFSDLFYKLRNDNENQLQGEQLLLCWECVAIMKKLKTFQNRIKNAQALLLVHWNMYNIKNDTIGLTCLSSLTRIDNDSFNEVLYKEEDLNNDELICNKFNDICPEEDKVYINLKLESNGDVLKQEDNGLENDNMDFNDVDYNDDDSIDGNPTDYFEIECKVKSSTDKKAKVSVKKQVHNRRKYLKYATITRNECISTKNYKKLCKTMHFSQKEYHDFVLKKEMDRLGSRLKIKCEKCEMAFLKNMDLLRHNSFVHNESSYPQKCAACKTMIQSKAKLSQHWTRVHTVMFKCTLCSNLERTVADIKRHIRELHIKTYTCNTCGFACSAFAEFVKHYKCHEVATCDICRSSFRHKNTLIEHIKYLHTPITCTICNRLYLNGKNLYEHNRKCHPELSNVETNQELSYCVECDKQFSSVLNYKSHLQYSVKHIPRKIVRVPCPECGKIFSKKAFMNNHYRFAHLKVTKHYCDKCNKYYTTGFGLRQHIARIHDKIPLPKNKFCDLCGRGFSTNGILIKHRRTHTGERPFKCDYCPASFAQQTAMKTHQRTQHKTDKLNKSSK